MGLKKQLEEMHNLIDTIDDLLYSIESLEEGIFSESEILENKKERLQESANRFMLMTESFHMNASGKICPRCKGSGRI